MYIPTYHMCVARRVSSCFREQALSLISLSCALCIAGVFVCSLRGGSNSTLPTRLGRCSPYERKGPPYNLQFESHRCAQQVSFLLVLFYFTEAEIRHERRKQRASLPLSPPGALCCLRFLLFGGEAMGMCQSTADPHGGAAFSGEGEPCPTVFELERMIEERRKAAVRLHVNLVNIEFRRSIFEVYRRGAADEDCDDFDGNGSGGGDDEPVDSIVMVGSAVAGVGAGKKKTENGDGDGVFVATHKVRWIFLCDGLHKVPAAHKCRHCIWR